jgi:hypothetical protein
VTQLLTDHNMQGGPKYQYKIHTNTQWHTNKGVCGCVCALVCMPYLCFLGFLRAVKCAVAGSLIATGVCLTCFKGSCAYAPR